MRDITIRPITELKQLEVLYQDHAAAMEAFTAELPEDLSERQEYLDQLFDGGAGYEFAGMMSARLQVRIRRERAAAQRQKRTGPNMIVMRRAEIAALHGLLIELKAYPTIAQITGNISQGCANTLSKTRGAIEMLKQKLADVDSEARMNLPAPNPEASPESAHGAITSTQVYEVDESMTGPGWNRYSDDLDLDLFAECLEEAMKRKGYEVKVIAIKDRKASPNDRLLRCVDDGASFMAWKLYNEKMSARQHGGSTQVYEIDQWGMGVDWIPEVDDLVLYAECVKQALKAAGYEVEVTAIVDTVHGAQLNDVLVQQWVEQVKGETRRLYNEKISARRS